MWCGGLQGRYSRAQWWPQETQGVFVPPSSCWLHPQTVFPGRRKLAARSVAASLGSRAESGSLCVRERQLTGSLWQPFLHVGKKLITLAKKQRRPLTNQPILKFERTLKRGSMSCLHMEGKKRRLREVTRNLLDLLVLS